MDHKDPNPTTLPQDDTTGPIREPQPENPLNALETFFAGIGEAFSNLITYLETRVDLAKLSVKEVFAGITAWVVTILVTAVVLSLSVGFFLYGLSSGLGEALGRPWLGFIIVGAFFWVAVITYFKMKAGARAKEALLKRIQHEKEKR